MLIDFVKKNRKNFANKMRTMPKFRQGKRRTRSRSSNRGNSKISKSCHENVENFKILPEPPREDAGKFQKFAEEAMRKKIDFSPKKIAQVSKCCHKMAARKRNSVSPKEFETNSFLTPFRPLSDRNDKIYFFF